MPPKVLILVQPASRTTIPIRHGEEWDAQSCARCERRIERDPAVYLVDGEVRCRLCVSSPPGKNACIWCGREGSRIQDTGSPMCQPHWTLYVAYVADEVEPPGSAFNHLLAEAKQAITEAKDVGDGDAGAAHDGR